MHRCPAQRGTCASSSFVGAAVNGFLGTDCTDGNGKKAGLTSRRFDRRMSELERLVR